MPNSAHAKTNPVSTKKPAAAGRKKSRFRTKPQAGTKARAVRFFLRAKRNFNIDCLRRKKKGPFRASVPVCGTKRDRKSTRLNPLPLHDALRISKARAVRFFLRAKRNFNVDGLRRKKKGPFRASVPVCGTK